MSSNDSVYRPLCNPRAVVRYVDGEHLIYCQESGEVHRLNETASFVFTLCDGAHSRSAIVDCMVEHYQIDYGQARSDVTALLAQFSAAGIISAEATNAQSDYPKSSRG